MPRFFISKTELENEEIIIGGEDAMHISHSLRMKAGEVLILCDGEGSDYICEITGFSKDLVYLKKNEVIRSESESPVTVTLYQGIPKGEKMETVIQKAVECGVSRIVPVEMQNCIVKISADSAGKKLSRWQKIASEAAKQCGRGKQVTVESPISYKAALDAAFSDEVAFICYEGEQNYKLGTLLSEKKPQTLSFFVGPEGGFSSSEVALALEKGLLSVSLGKRILRTETAPLFVLAAISSFYELM